MAKWDKFRTALLSGMSDFNIEFRDLTGYLLRLGFTERISKGSHHIYGHPGIPELINIQKQPDGKVKAYQIEQAHNIILRYGL
jgi:predicted RNA binding protein YcfA (HicA-like mRNA interferase family)